MFVWIVKAVTGAKCAVLLWQSNLKTSFNEIVIPAIPLSPLSNNDDDFIHPLNLLHRATIIFVFLWLWLY